MTNKIQTTRKKKLKRKKKESQAIRALNSNNDIIIKPTDKGSAIVINTREQCITEKLSNAQIYKPMDTDPIGQVIQKVNLRSHNMLQREQISQNM